MNVPMNIGQFARHIIKQNPAMKNDDVLNLVKAQFPQGKTTYACIAWYKTDMRKKGLLPSGQVRTKEMVEAELKAASELVEKLTEELAEMTPAPDESEMPEEQQEEQAA
jgi:hypothetical protein